MQIHRSNNASSKPFRCAPACLKELIQLWPVGAAALLKKFGLNWDRVNAWIDMRSALADAEIDALFEHLRITKADEWPGSREEDAMANIVRHELSGGYLIKASAARPFRDLYDELSHGGDLRVSRELLGPRQQQQSLSMRVLAFAAHGGELNLALMPRTPWVDAMLVSNGQSRKRLINFAGRVCCSMNVWKDVCALVDSQGEVEHVERAGSIFERRHFDMIEWLCDRQWP